MQAVILFVLIVSILAPGAIAQSQWAQAGPAGQAVSLADALYTVSGLGQSNTRSYSLDVGAPVWQANSPGMTWHYAVSGNASVFDADVPGTSSMTQNVYVRTPSMLWQFPGTTSNSDRLGISCSDDCNRIVAFSNSTLVAFDAGAPTTIPLGFTALGVDVAADGSAVLVTGDLAIRVFSLPTLSTLYSASSSSYTFHAQGMSGAAERFGIGRIGQVDVYERVGSTYAFSFSHALAGTNYCDRLDISKDGSTLAAAFDFYDTNRKVGLEVVNLVTQATVYSASWETASMTNFASGVGISMDGATVALGMWGDGSGPVPELVFVRNGLSIGYSMPASVLDLDLAQDGTTCAVGTKDVHATAGNNSGTVSYWWVSKRLGG